MNFKTKTYRSEKYKAFVRTLPCCACGTTQQIEAHHTETGGTGMKGSDGFCIPLCFRHHQEHNAQGKVSFYMSHNLDRWEVVARTLEKYQKEKENGK